MTTYTFGLRCNMTQKPMIVLTGPTAVGKTALSIELAKKINGAIISADSMQVYKYMDIGSAKVTVDEMDGIKHYLIDELEPSDEFNVFIFKDMAKKALNEIYEAGKIPIVVGGTGFYIQALLYDIDFTKQDVDESYRKSLYDFANEHGNHALHEKLKDIDPASYESIHENNVKRVIRAIEYYHTCHEPISKHNETERAKQSPYNFAYFVLDDVRQRLYERIDKRVDIMVSNGLVDEVKKLKAMGCTSDMVSMKGIGYKEILAYLDGEYSLDEAVDKVKLESRRFAKRQLTWFRREKDTIWIEKNEKELKERFDKIDTNAEYNQLKVIAAMQKNKVSAECFQASSGYGYNDLGRDTLERVYADCFGAEDALVRPQITCGTHALALALMSNLRPGDELLSPVGKPYDTLEEVIGIRPSKGSLAEYGITYAQVDLLPDGEFDYDGIKKAINEKTKLVTIQRSKGYATRPTLSVKRIGELIAFVKSIKPDVICMVDNCYGEFVEDTEPIQVGADMMVGSLIKNPGGGLAPIGGYIVGKKECVENAAYRLTSPGLGKEVGASLGVIQSFYQGFFLAPTVVSGALKGAIFAAKIYEKLGFKVVPDGTESRHDIIQAVEFNNRDAMIAFCEGIQAAAPVDSYVTPEPWAMPGYDSDVIMAAGAFVQGSSIELSADGPVKPPYAVYFQGGLTWYHAKLGILM